MVNQRIGHGVTAYFKLEAPKNARNKLYYEPEIKSNYFRRLALRSGAVLHKSQHSRPKDFDGVATTLRSLFQLKSASRPSLQFFVGLAETRLSDLPSVQIFLSTSSSKT